MSARTRTLPVRPEKLLSGLCRLEGICRRHEDGGRQCAQVIGGIVAGVDGPSANPRLSRLELSLFMAILGPMRAKNLFGGYGMRCDRAGDPSQIEEMADVDVLGRDIATPGSAG